MPLIYSSEKRSKRFIRRNYLVLLGILVIAGTFFYDNYYKKRILSFRKSVPEVEQKKTFKPVKIIIDSVGVNLDVEEGKIENGVWQISEKGATHLDISANPGDGGNIVIYGHNKKHLFGPIKIGRAHV